MERRARTARSAVPGPTGGRHQRCLTTGGRAPPQRHCQHGQRHSFWMPCSSATARKREIKRRSGLAFCQPSNRLTTPPWPWPWPTVAGVDDQSPMLPTSTTTTAARVLHPKPERRGAAKHLPTQSQARPASLWRQRCNSRGRCDKHCHVADHRAGAESVAGSTIIARPTPLRGQDPAFLGPNILSVAITETVARKPSPRSDSKMILRRRRRGCTVPLWPILPLLPRHFQPERFPSATAPSTTPKQSPPM